MDPINVRRMLAADMDRASEIIGLAFADNPSTLANVRGDRARAQRMMQSATLLAKLGRSSSHAYVAEAGTRVVGALNAAMWPRCQLGTRETLHAAPTMLRVMGSALPRALKMMNARAKHDPQEPHWHVGPIGVDPDFQGRGVGKALLASFLAMSDEHGSPAFLETDVDRNVAFYQQFGFTVIAREDILDINTRFMWRETHRHKRKPSRVAQ